MDGHSATLLAQVQKQIQMYWSYLFMDQLHARLLLPSLVNKQYSGEIKPGGNTVRVTQFHTPKSEILQISTDPSLHQAFRFQATPLQTSNVDVVADKRIVASFKIEDLVDLQSQIGQADSELTKVMFRSVNEQLNEFLYGYVNPEASSPDCIINSTSAFTSDILKQVRVLAGKLKWSIDDQLFGLMTSDYWGDFITDTKLANTEYHADDVIIQGKGFRKRMGFFCTEDNSIPTSLYGDKFALFFEPSWLLSVMQKAPTVKISDLHPNQEFGYVVSLDMIVGAKLGIDGGLRHIVVTSKANGF